MVLVSMRNVSHMCPTCSHHAQNPSGPLLTLIRHNRHDVLVTGVLRICHTSTRYQSQGYWAFVTPRSGHTQAYRASLTRILGIGHNKCCLLGHRDTTYLLGSTRFQSQWYWCLCECVPHVSHCVTTSAKSLWAPVLHDRSQQA